MMRRMVMIVVVAVLSVSVAGCLEGLLGQLLPDESVAGLKQFSSSLELKTYLSANARQGMMGRGGILGLVPGAMSPPVDMSNSPSAEGDDGGSAYSQTNLQEAGVDEADVVKTDGEYLYVAGTGTLRVVDLRPAAEMSVVGEVAIEGGVDSLYLYGSKAVVVGEAQAYRVMPMWDVDFVMQDQASITIVDVSDPSNPTVMKTYVLDGWLRASRRVDNWLRVVLTMYPNVPAMPLLSDVDTWLPRMSVVEPDGVVTSSVAVDVEDMYYPIVPDGTTMTSLVSIDLDDVSADPSTVSLVGDPEIVYASTTALYVSDSKYGYGSVPRETTVLHKFDFSGADVVYAGSGSVPGRLHNEFSLGEYEGYLRVATTTGGGWGVAAEPSRNNVYVLGAAGTASEPALEVVGRVEGLAEGETIYAARFVGSRGFLVTFEQIDPLFVLDLSDPTHPTAAGELKVPGYSEYLHPLGENHLLAVGKDVDVIGQTVYPQGVQVSLFDISDLTDPQLQDSVVLGTAGSDSEALWGHHAFTYFEDQNALAIPVTLYEGGQGGPTWGQLTFAGVYVFHVTPEDGFTELGRIATAEVTDGMWERWGWWYYWEWTRTVFVGDDVYAATPAGVRAVPLADVNAEPWTVDFE